jgi:hypothetical protein
MEKFRPTSPEIESHYEENIRGYADAAERLAKEYVWPQNIWKALMHEQGPNRATLFADVVEEIKRRKLRTKQVSSAPKPNQAIKRIVDQPDIFLAGAIQNAAFHAHRAEPPENIYLSEDRGDDF